MKFAYKKAKYIIANSNDTMKDLLKYKIVPQNKVRIISNPIDIPKIKDKKLKLIKKLIKNKYVVVGCGSLSYQKNFKLLIKSFYLFQKKIPNSYLIILGEGEIKDELINIISKNKIKDKVKIIKPINNPYNLFNNQTLVWPVQDLEINADNIPSVVIRIERSDGAAAAWAFDQNEQGVDHNIISDRSTNG